MHVEVILGVITQLSIVFFITEYFKTNNNLNKKSVFALTIFLFSGLILFYFLDRISILIYIGCLILYNYLIIRNINQSITYVSISSIIMVMSDFISNVLIEYFSINSFSIYLIVLIFISIVITIIIDFFLRKFINPKKYITSIIILLVLIAYYIIIFSVVSNNGAIDLSKITDLTTIFLLMLVAFLIIMVIEYRISERKLDKILKEKERQYLEQYYSELEEHYKEMRIFKHDYENLISSMEIYLSTNDLEGLKKNFNDLKQYENLNSEIDFKMLNNIKIKNLRGFIYKKIKEAEKKGIRINIECVDEISDINMNILDLIRYLGIVIDNAVEESISIGNNYVDIAFIKMMKNTTIIVKNKCRNNIENLDILFKEDFSTKDKSRGLGLTSLERLLGKYDNINHEVSITDNFFIQKIIVYNKEN